MAPKSAPAHASWAQQSAWLSSAFLFQLFLACFQHLVVGGFLESAADQMFPQRLIILKSGARCTMACAGRHNFVFFLHIVGGGHIFRRGFCVPATYFPPRL